VYKNPLSFALKTEYKDDTLIITGQILDKEKIFYQISRNGRNIFNFLDDYDDQLKLWINSY
jgi:hypothetical protein